MGFSELQNLMEVDQRLLALADQARHQSNAKFAAIDTVVRYNQAKVLKAFQDMRITDAHLHGTTGYGYNDLGRDALDGMYAQIFNTEDAVVRGQFVSGTHAIASVLQALLHQGDHLIFAGGKPYDTLHKVVGWTGHSQQSLFARGVEVDIVENTSSGDLDRSQIIAAIRPETKMIHFQRSRGYTMRRAWSCAELEPVFKAIKALRSDIIIYVDNCYGEFVEMREPTDVGADIMAGSLIKNPGGGLALWGGYIVGSKALIADVMEYVVAPGLGKDMGGTTQVIRGFYQGLFMAPHVVGQALKGAIFAANMLMNLGFTVDPQPQDERFDIIQAVVMDSREQLLAFCQGIQQGSPIDSMALPIPDYLPGYSHEVVMAAGTFVQGASIELSADAPLVEPYVAYMQGGLTLEHVELGILIALNNMIERQVLML